MKQIRSILQGLLSSRKTDRSKALDDIEDLLSDNSLSSYDSESIAGQLMDLLDSDIYGEYTKCKNYKIKNHQDALRKIIHVAEVLRKLVQKTFTTWEKANMFAKFYSHVESVMYSPEALFIVTEYIRMAEFILDDDSQISEEWCCIYLNNLIQIYKDSKLTHKVGDYIVEINSKAVLDATLQLVHKYHHFIIPQTEDILSFISLIWKSETDYNKIAVSLEILNTFILSIFPNQMDSIQQFIVNEFRKLPTLYRQQNSHLVDQLVIFMNTSISILFGTSLVDELSLISDEYDTFYDLLLKLLSSFALYNERYLTNFHIFPYILYTCKYKKSSICLYERITNDKNEKMFLLLLNCLADMIVRLPERQESDNKRQKTMHILQIFLLDNPNAATNVILLISFIFLKYHHSFILQEICDQYISDASPSTQYFYAYTLFQYKIINLQILNSDHLDAYNWYYLVKQTTFRDVEPPPTNTESLLYYHDMPFNKYSRIMPNRDLFSLSILASKLESNSDMGYPCFNKHYSYIEQIHCIAVGCDLLFEDEQPKPYLEMKKSSEMVDMNSTPELDADLKALLIPLMQPSLVLPMFPQIHFKMTNLKYQSTPYGKLTMKTSFAMTDLTPNSECARYIASNIKQNKSPNNLILLLNLLSIPDTESFILDALTDFASLYSTSVYAIIHDNLEYLTKINVSILSPLLHISNDQFYELFPWYFNSIHDYKHCISLNCLNHPIPRFMAKILPKVFLDKEYGKFIKDHVLVDIECNKSFLMTSIVWLVHYHVDLTATLKSFDQLKALSAMSILREKKKCDLGDLLAISDLISILLEFMEIVQNVIFNISPNYDILLQLLNHELVPHVLYLCDNDILLPEYTPFDCPDCLLSQISPNCPDEYKVLLHYALTHFNKYSVFIIQYCISNCNHTCRHYQLFNQLDPMSINTLMSNISSNDVPIHIYNLLALHALLRLLKSNKFINKSIKFTMNNDILLSALKRAPWHLLLQFVKLNYLQLTHDTDYIKSIFQMCDPNFKIDFTNHPNPFVLKCNSTFNSSFWQCWTTWSNNGSLLPLMVLN